MDKIKFDSIFNAVVDELAPKYEGGEGVIKKIKDETGGSTKIDATTMLGLIYSESLLYSQDLVYNFLSKLLDVNE